jgi:hypothetical protein
MNKIPGQLTLFPCDMCRVKDWPCPGQDAHCGFGYHCTDVIEVCAIDASRDDHSDRCCHCKKETD